MVSFIFRYCYLKDERIENRLFELEQKERNTYGYRAEFV